MITERSTKRSVKKEAKPMESSTRDKKRRVQFRLAAPAGSQVFVAGTFNKWDPKATPLKEAAGGFAAMVMLLPGRYEYKFVVNGDWMTDPKGNETVPNGLGSRNSVIVI
jgi:1,4-alpha-glucan branching enzyme